MEFEKHVLQTTQSVIEQRSGAAEARWAHNPKVGGSKPPFAIFVFNIYYFFHQKIPQPGVEPGTLG